MSNNKATNSVSIKLCGEVAFSGPAAWCISVPVFCFAMGGAMFSAFTASRAGTAVVPAVWLLCSDDTTCGAAFTVSDLKMKQQEKQSNMTRNRFMSNAGQTYRGISSRCGSFTKHLLRMYKCRPWGNKCPKRV